MNFAALMSGHDRRRQQMLLRIMFGDDARQQIALGRDYLAVFVGIFVEQRRIALFHQPTNRLAQLAALFARAIPVVAVFDVAARQLRIRAAHQRIFHRPLNLMDIDFSLLRDRCCHLRRQLLRIVVVIHRRRLRRCIHRLHNALRIKRHPAAVAFNYHADHVVPSKNINM